MSISLSDNWRLEQARGKGKGQANDIETLQQVQHSSLSLPPSRLRCAFADVWPAINEPLNEQHSYHFPSSLPAKSSLETAASSITGCLLPTLNCMPLVLDVAERVYAS